MASESATFSQKISALLLRWRRRSGGVANLAPLAAVVLFLLAMALAFWYLRTEQVRRDHETVQRDVEYAQQQLRLRLLDRQEQLMLLARDISNSDMRSHQFEARAHALINLFHELIALSWLDSERRLLSSQSAPRLEPLPHWLQGEQLRPGPLEAGFGLARDLRQPVFFQPPAVSDAEPMLYLFVPILKRDGFAGTLLAEFSVDGLLRHGISGELLSKYAVALLDEKGSVLAGQNVDTRFNPALKLPWLDPLIESATPISPVGNGLWLRVQAWRTSQGLVGSTLFWMVGALSLLTAWMLITNWRHARRRTQVQRALQVETAFRRAMENSMLTGMRAMDLQGRITYVNPAFCQMTGWSEQELLGQTEPFLYWPPEDHSRLSKLLKEQLAGQLDPNGVQLQVRRKNGSHFEARLYISPLIDASGQQTGWMASMTDITEPNRVRRELAASHERFSVVMDALDASVSVTPLGSNELLFANKLYRQWFGTGSEGHMKLLVRGGTLAANVSADSSDASDPLAGLPVDSMEEMETSQPAENAEIYLDSLDKWLEVRSRYLTWVDGRLAQMVIATDITARRAAEELAAVQAERAQAASRLVTMGEMASSVAHELNQPLTAISNYCTGMISRLKNGSIQTDDLLVALDKTARQAQRAGQVVQHIRSFVKRSEPRRQWTAVDAIMEQVLELAEVEVRRRQVRLTHSVSPGLRQLYADPILIGQVLLNLIKNGAESIDHAQRPPGQRLIELRVQPLEIDHTPVVQFSISDSGQGLPAEVQERLFQAFFSTKSEGMGIGLNLCRSIVEAHHGRIQAVNLYNADRIVGCRFSFWIPVGPRPAAASGAKPPHLPPEQAQ